MLLDTSAFVAIFVSSENSDTYINIKSVTEDEEIYFSEVQLAEIADWAVRNSVDPAERINLVKGIARLLPLSEVICLNAARIKSDRRRNGASDFGIIDGIILASARAIGHRVITLDKHFSGEPDCFVIN